MELWFIIVCTFVFFVRVAIVFYKQYTHDHDNHTDPDIPSEVLYLMFYLGMVTWGLVIIILRLAHHFNF